MGPEGVCISEMPATREFFQALSTVLFHLQPLVGFSTILWNQK